MVDTARYWLGILLVVSLPPALPYWYLIHGWPAFWRRLGKWPTLILHFSLIFVLIWALVQVRGTLMGRDLGFTIWTTVAAIALYIPTVLINRARARYLTFGILAGLPEIAPEQHEPKLLREGIYGRVRHPRYIEVILGVAAWALFINYSGVYVVVLACIVGVLAIIPLEERELAERFGAAFGEYKNTVPMLIPKRSPAPPLQP